MTKPSRAVASPRVVNAGDLPALGPSQVAEGGFRLPGRRRRRRGHAPRKLPGISRSHLPTASCGCGTSLRFAHACLGLRPFLSRPACSRGLQPPDASRRRSRGRSGRRNGGHRIHSLHHLRAPAGGRQGSLLGACVLPTLSVGWPRAAEAAIERARLAGFSALVVTIDTPVAGMRERDFRNGMKELISGSLLEKLPFLPQVLARPGWLLSFLLDGGLPPLPNVVIPGQGPMPLVDVNAALARSTVTWEDLRWIRDLWRGPVVIKGVLTGDDARRAVDEGAAALVVSNHGGRQLDCVPAASESAAGSRGRRERPDRSADGRRHSSRQRHREGYLPGSPRGSVWARLCLRPRGRGRSRSRSGAGDLAGRLERTLKLLGCPSVAALDRSYVNVPSSWEAGSITHVR